MNQLFTPYDLSGIPLANRVVMAPMTRTRTLENIPDELTALYYAQLWHVGRMSHVSIQTGNIAPVGPSAVAAENTTVYAWLEPGKAGPVQPRNFAKLTGAH